MSHIWTTRGFEAFRRGTFGNAGQNLYVSRKGILQRIHLFDLNEDGYFDLTFCNAQNHAERPDTWVYVDPLGECKRIDLPAEGAVTAVAADLTGNGYDDLVLGMASNGIDPDLNAIIYYGSERGWGEHATAQLPAPQCSGVTVGDFNGDGKQALAFLSAGKLRLFRQSEIGFEPKQYEDLPISGDTLVTFDIDGDGYDDLVLLGDTEPDRIYWGGPNGIDASQFVDLPEQRTKSQAKGKWWGAAEEAAAAYAPIANVVRLNDTPHVFVPRKDEAILIPVNPDRSFGSPLRFKINEAMSVTTGSATAPDATDLIFTAADSHDGQTVSWLYHQTDAGYNDDHRTALPSMRACDVAVADLDGDGKDEIAICQYRSDDMYSVESPVYRLENRERMLSTNGARAVLAARYGKDQKPCLIYINQFARNAIGQISPTIYWGSKDGYTADRKTELQGLGCVNALCTDLNDNGIPDLIQVNCAENALHLDPGTYVYFGSRNNPDRFGPNPDTILPTTHAMAMVVGDINRDGYLDAISVGFSVNELTIFFGNESGFDTENPQRITMEDNGTILDEGRRMCLVDLNNDGWLDLVVTFNNKERAYILWGGPDGFSWENRKALSIIRPSTPIAADLTGNGYRDLIVGGHKRSNTGPHDSFVYIYWNGPEGISDQNRTLLPANAVLGLAVGDFNNDGYNDLFVANYANGRERDVDSYIYWGADPNGDEPMFSARRRLRVRTHSAAGCIAADFNEDGRVDLAVANHKMFGDHVGESFVLWNGPDGLDFANPTRLPTAGPHGMYHTPPGNQADRSDEEHYISEPYEVPQGLRVKDVTWQAALGPKTWVKTQVRAAETKDALDDAPWVDQDLAPPGRWMQYRLTLGATNSGSTPRVSQVDVVFDH